MSKTKLGEASIKSLADFLVELRKRGGGLYRDENKRIYFRGEPQCYCSDAGDTRLMPAAHRNLKHDTVDRLLRRNPDEFHGLKGIDLLAKLQHYGIGTNMLDVTTNPMVALFFACGGDGYNRNSISTSEGMFSALKKSVKDAGDGGGNDIKKLETFDVNCELVSGNEDGYVYIFNASKSKVLPLGSHIPTILAVISRMTEDEQKIISKVGFIEALSDNPYISLDSYKNSKNREIIRKFILECARETNGEIDINPHSINGVFFIKPSMKNRRMKNQEGLFAIHGAIPFDDQLINPRKELISSEFLNNPIVIDGKSKLKILAELKFFAGISYGTMYEDFDDVINEPKDRLYKYLIESFK